MKDNPSKKGRTLKGSILKGFTLIEMLVSIAIIGMMTGLFIANYHTANKRTDLIMTAQSLVANIHLAQNNTLGLVKYNSVVPAGGWGINFNKANNYYTLFADQNAPGESGYMDYDAASEGNINYGARVVTLSPGITISSLKFGGVEAAAPVNATFLPPDPQTNIYSNGATTTVLEIQLKEAQNNTIKTVRLNFLGLVEVIN